MRLRRPAAPAQIETTPHGYRLVAEHVEVDVERFERRVTQGSGLLGLGEPERAAHSSSEALALWRSEPRLGARPRRGGTRVQIAGRVLSPQEWAELVGSRSHAPACGE
ncbi:hypothetical protein HP550_11110 [Cellulomonas humilata]|uniref:Bacterial transcriptional activator domain-containing protein n=1 Tax=Cellulomonas humilata TaxID=144055 RepID=A0A7Y6DWT3_9CELL|nr:hypothetical protein [Cellulomonas humilata]